VVALNWCFELILNSDGFPIWSAVNKDMWSVDLSVNRHRLCPRILKKKNPRSMALFS
jgi:hypothetical protein